MTWLRNASAPDAGLVDVEIAGGMIARVVPASGELLPGDTDLAGQLLLPSFAEPHAHLDKALTACRAVTRPNDLRGAIRAMARIADTMPRADIVARAGQAIGIQLSLGTTSIRTHANIGARMGMRALSALTEVRERWRGLVDVQVVAMVSDPMAERGQKDLRQALREGADVAGGAPHLDPEPDRAVGICLDVAGEAGVPVDLHTDEELNPGMLTLVTLAGLVRRTGFPHQVTASHCVSLAVCEQGVQREVAEQVAAAGINVITLPQTNLYLQGRDRAVATPRGLTAVAALRAAGVTVAAGGDNLRDPFHPVGRGDALEVAALMVTAGHLDPADALGSVTAAPRAVLGLPPVSVAPGHPADLVAMPAADGLEALGAAPVQRTVWRAGEVVARTTVHSEVRTPPSPARPR